MGPLGMVVGRAGMNQTEAGRRSPGKTKVPFKTGEAEGLGGSQKPSKNHQEIETHSVAKASPSLPELIPTTRVTISTSLSSKD